MLEQGIVTSVDYNEGVVTCSVKPLRGSNAYPSVPVLKPIAGAVRMPKQGQKVAMASLDDDTRFILGVIARNADGERPDDAAPGDMTFQLDGDTKLEIADDGNGNYNVTLSGSGNLTVSAPNGTVTIDASEVTIDGIDFDQHTHDFEDETIEDTGDGSGSSSTTTKQTGPPK